MGLAGGLPYVGSALTTVYLARQAGEVATGKALVDFVAFFSLML